MNSDPAQNGCQVWVMMRTITNRIADIELIDFLVISVIGTLIEKK